MKSSDGFLHQKLVQPFLNQLKQGTSPESLALTCAIGTALGIFPLLGVTTFLCVLIGLVWKLNQPVLQVVNYVLYPVQLVLLPSFISLGESMMGSEKVSFNISTIVSEFKSDPRVFLSHYGVAGLEGVMAWAMVAPFLAWTVYQISLRIFLRLRVNA